MTEKLRQSKRSSKSPYRTRTPSSKRSLAFSSPSTTTSNSAVSLVPPSLSPAAHAKAPDTDRALTFLQSARDRNVPVRCGKWSQEEDAYLEKLLALFQDGLLTGLEPKTSLRSWLAYMLNCCPMRISKKQMHGRQFVGKVKYKRSACKLEKMTQQQYDELCDDVWQLRAAFLKAWAKDEYGRRSASIRAKEASFQDWYDKVRTLVPTPTIAKRSSWTESKTKRTIESLDELRLEMQQEAKRHKVEMLVEIRKKKEQYKDQEQQQEQPQEQPQPQEQETLELVEIAPLEPAPIPSGSTPPPSSSDSVVLPLPTAYCSETVSMGDWLTGFDDRGCVAHWNDVQNASHTTSEARYTFCEDQVQVSVRLRDQQHSMAELSMSRRSSRLVIDFGAPSCWHTDEEPKRTPLSDYSQWTDTDLTEELAMIMEPGLFGWDDSSPMSHVTYSPTLNFL